MEQATFAASEEELTGDIDTLERAIGILEKELAKSSGAFAQDDATGCLQSWRLQERLQVSANDNKRVSALIQLQQGNDDLIGAPAAAVYESKAGGIVDVLVDLKEKAESELSVLRKAEDNAKHNFDMLKQSLVDSIKEDNTDLTQPAAKDGKAVTEGDLAVTRLITRQPSQPVWRSLL